MKSGFVSIVGRPNSGKSTLLNHLVGEKVSIVTDKPQTTRHVVRGIVTRKKLLLLNKIDLIEKKNLLPLMERYSNAGNFEEIIPISALTGENVENLMAQVMKYLPEGPMFYPEEQISDQSERAIAAEMIREKLIILTEEELPYSTAVVTDRF